MQATRGHRAAHDVEYGAHLPLIGSADWSLPALKAYVRTAAALGFRYLCANDHLVFGRPWLDGPTMLAALIDESGEMRLATTASLPVVRGPVQLAKALAAIDVLSGGRLVVGAGPGSSAADYAAAGLRFSERWRRFDEAVQALRALPLPIGPAEVCAERLAAFVAAGAQRIFVWPLGDEVAQLELFWERVVPLVPLRA